MSKSKIKDRSYKNPKWLKEMYWEQGYSACAIAKICKRSPSTIYKYMKKLKIPCRSISEANKGKSIKNLQGQRFGRLTVLRDSGKRTLKGGYVIWACLCACGNFTRVSSSSLRSGHTRSCGCLQRELVSKRFVTHGESKTKLYRVWVSIRQGCYNPKVYGYKYYGDKGITVYSEWRNDYLAFKTWALANGYEKGLVLNRRDKNENYTPENCQWITRSRSLFKHGRTKTRLYKVWVNMKHRCHDPKARNYKHYGGRGIQVCAEWKNDFIAFRNWALNNGYADNLCIDRIENNGNYEPSNIQFLTNSENSKKRWKDLRKERERLFAMIIIMLMRKKRIGWI